MPPWPGKILPVSLILAFLFKYEKNKSPIWQPIEVIIESIIIKSEKLLVNKKNNVVVIIHDNKIEPKAPE